MISLTYDLHIHSCLSPCGDDNMTPGNIAGMASINGLDVIAVTDHNSCKNCPAVLHFAEEYGIMALPGMELCTSEEVHVLCLFGNLDDALNFDAFVYGQLIPFPNNEKVFGKQQIYDLNDQPVGTVENLLVNATHISFDRLYDMVTQYNGIMIPAHIDKTSTSLLSNLGFVPDESKFTCVELRQMSRLHSLKKENPYLEKCNIITCSDAHYLVDINEAHHTIFVDEKSPEGILSALKTKL